MDVSTGFKTGDVDVAQTRNLALSSALKDLLVEDSGVMRTEHIYAPEMEKLSSKNQILMRAYMQQARERQRIRRAMQEAEEGGDTLYPKLRRPTPESMFRAR